MSGVFDEPRELATVQRLHTGQTDAGEGEEWYETERLTGHLTGGAHPSHTDLSEPEGGGPLGWRAGPPEPERAPMLKRLRAGALARRRLKDPEASSSPAVKTPAPDMVIISPAPDHRAEDCQERAIADASAERSEGMRLALRGEQTDRPGDHGARSARHRGRRTRSVVMVCGAAIALVAVLGGVAAVLALEGARTPQGAAFSAGRDVAHTPTGVRLTASSAGASYALVRGSSAHSAGKHRSRVRSRQRTRARRPRAGHPGAGRTRSAGVTARTLVAAQVSDNRPETSTAGAGGSAASTETQTGTASTKTSSAASTTSAAVSRAVLPPAPDQNTSAPAP